MATIITFTIIGSIIGGIIGGIHGYFNSNNN